MTTLPAAEEVIKRLHSQIEDLLQSITKDQQTNVPGVFTKYIKAANELEASIVKEASAYSPEKWPKNETLKLTGHMLEVRRLLLDRSMEPEEPGKRSPSPANPQRRPAAPTEADMINMLQKSVRQIQESQRDAEEQTRQKLEQLERRGSIKPKTKESEVEELNRNMREFSESVQRAHGTVAAKSIAVQNDEKYDSMMKPQNFIQPYNTFAAGLAGALAGDEGLSHKLTPPDTLDDLLNWNIDIQGSMWSNRVQRRTMNNDKKDRFDTAVDTANTDGHWSSIVHFPVVAIGGDSNWYGYFVPVCYSSFKLNAQQLMHEPNYVLYQVTPTLSINLDSTYLGDVNARQSVTAAILNTWPVQGSYISFLISLPFNGASCGLAVCLAIMGSPPVAATGFIHSTNALKEDDMVEHIDHMSVKAALAIRNMFPLICPSKDVLGNSNPIFKQYSQNLFTSGMWNSSKLEWKFDPMRHYLVLATTLTEAAMLACHVWQHNYETRPDVAVLRNKMLKDAANWQAQRRQLVDTNGGINVRNMMSALGKPFIGTPYVDEDTKFTGRAQAAGRFLDPDPGEIMTDEMPSAPLGPARGRKPPPKKKRGR